MKSKTTLWLFLVVLGIVGIFFVAKKRVPSTEENSEYDRHVLHFKIDEVRGIRILGLDQELRFEKQGEFWNIVHPIQVRANEHEIEGMLSVLEDLESRRRLTPALIAEAKLTLADYGLLKPKTVLQVGLGEKSFKIHLGNLSRQGDGLYIQVAGDSCVYLVDKEISRRLGKKLDDYRDRSIFEIQASQVQRFQIKNASSLVEFVKTNAQWRLTQPLIARADQAVVQKLLEQSVAAQVDRFLSEDPVPPTEWGLDETARELSFWGREDETPQTLLLGNKLRDDETKVAAKVKGKRSIFAVSVNHWLDTGHPVQDYRDRSLAQFEPPQIKEIELKSHLSPVVLRRNEGGWRMIQPLGVDADTEIVETILQKLGKCQIKEFTTDVLTDLEKYGLKNPTTTWVLRDRTVSSETLPPNGPESHPVLELALGREDVSSKTLYVKRLDESSIYGLDLSELPLIPRDSLHLRSRLLFQLPKETITTCKMKKGKSQVGLERTLDGKWKLSEGTVGVLNEGAFLQFQNLMEHFKVQGIVGTALNSTIKTFGLESPAAVIQISSTDSPKSGILELVVGHETPSKQFYLIWKEQLLLCEISQEFHRILTQEWVKKISTR